MPSVSQLKFFIFPHHWHRRILYCPFNLAPSPPFNQGPPPPLYNRMRQANKNKEAGSHLKQYIKNLSTSWETTEWFLGINRGLSKEFYTLIGSGLASFDLPGIWFWPQLGLWFELHWFRFFSELELLYAYGWSKGTNPKIGLWLLFLSPTSSLLTN